MLTWAIKSQYILEIISRVFNASMYIWCKVISPFTKKKINKKNNIDTSFLNKFIHHSVQSKIIDEKI